MINKPMLAADHDPAALRFPYDASFKLDGYRAFNSDARLLTRSGKLVTNTHTQKLFSAADFDGLDGELIVGPWNLKNTFGNTSGPVRKAVGEPDVAWYVFDDRTYPKDPFEARKERLRERVATIRERGGPNIIFLEQERVEDEAALTRFEEKAIEMCFEGVMLRSPTSPYKFGRSTVLENYLLKVKRFVTAEARITGMEEQMINLNPAFLDELGRTKRSEAKDGLIGSGMVGAFWVESPDWPRPFKISAGSMSHDEKRHAWTNKHEFLNQLARYSYFPHGIKDVPRHGLFDGIRDEKDL